MRGVFLKNYTKAAAVEETNAVVKTLLSIVNPSFRPQWSPIKIVEEHLSMNASFPANSRRKNANRPEGNVGRGIEPSNKAVRPTFFSILSTSFNRFISRRILVVNSADVIRNFLRRLRGRFTISERLEKLTRRTKSVTLLIITLTIA